MQFFTDNSPLFYSTFPKQVSHKKENEAADLLCGLVFVYLFVF